jgi:glycosyltransferase involved in cell wall biosynthesis
VLLNPITWNEPFGLTMVEAIACGTPVLSFSKGAATEIIDEGVTGLLCNDVDEMVERLPAVAGLDRRACRKVAETRFSSDRMVDEHLALYESLISARREGRTPAAGLS